LWDRSERSIMVLYYFPRSGIEDSREFPSSQIPGKSFVCLPMLSSMPPVRSASDKTGVRQSFGLSRLLRVRYEINVRQVFAI